MKDKPIKTFYTYKELEDWAGHYAEIKKSDHEDENKWLIFQLAEERFMVSLDDLDEITPVQNGIRLSSVNMNIMGLMNLRGDITVIADLGQIIGIRQTPEPDKNQRILFINDNNGKNVGFLVDRVEGISSLDNQQISIDVGSNKNDISQYIKFIAENNEKPVACIDIPAVLKETWNH